MRTAIRANKSAGRCSTAQRAFGVACSLLPFMALASSTGTCAAQGTAASGSVMLGSLPAGAVRPVPLVLGPGDLLDVQVFGTKELSGVMRVDDAGYVALPLGGRVKVADETADDASIAIETQLKANGVMLNPHVSVSVNQYATEGITVAGEVNRPGTYTLLGPHSLYDAISAAGGTTADSGAHITITHHSDPARPTVIDIHSRDYSAAERMTSVEPGDTVVVSHADLVYVVGDVERPGSFPIVSGVPISVLNVLSLSAGLNRTALAKHASIIRQTGDQVVTIPIDLDKIMKSKAPNPVLQASDILVVPRSGKKVFLEYALPATTNAAATAVGSALVLR